MNEVVNYVLENQDKITTDKSIDIKFGLGNLNNKIIDTRIKKTSITKLFNILKESNFTIKSNMIKYRIYQYLNLEYRVVNENHKCIKQSLENISVSQDSDITYLLGINNYVDKDISDFPSQKEYNEIINRNEINLYIDQIFRLTTYIDQTSNNEYIHLTLSIIRQNIFKEKITKSLKKILGHIDESLNEEVRIDS